MPNPWIIFCDSPELAVDLTREAARIDLALSPEIADAPTEAAAATSKVQSRVGVVAENSLSADALVELSDVARRVGHRVPVAIIAPQPLGMLHDLGLPAVHEVGPFVALAALLDLDTDRPWAAATQGLPSVDRVRLGESVSHESDGRFIRLDDGLVGHESSEGSRAPIGTPRDTAAALHSLRASQPGSRPKVPEVEGVESDVVLDVILGPRRALSDPASKAALRPYDVPLPLEELCATPSRTASEASRIGFPVHVGLASPDLRLWDHPDLSAEVYSAGQARDAFRQIMALAKTRSDDARLLGVTVSASTLARTLLHVRMEPLASGAILTDIGFADPHGRASSDTTRTVLPATAKALERVLLRLRGSSLLVSGPPRERSAAVSAIGDVLMRLAAFAHQWREEIESIEVNPLAILVGGELEVREVCINVGDAFSRSLNASG